MGDLSNIRAAVDELLARAPWWRGWARPLRKAEIESFEAQHGVRLPETYRQVLLQVGDRAPLPARPPGRIEPLFRARELPVASSFAGPLASPFTFYGSAPVEVPWSEAADDYEDPHWLRGCLPLTSGGCDIVYVLVVSGAERGKVWRAAPSGVPELHPTGMQFAPWYLQELERGLEPLRTQARRERMLRQRLAENSQDLEAARELGSSLLLRDLAEAETLLESAFAARQALGETSGRALLRSLAELDLLTGRKDRWPLLTGQPELRVYAGIAAAREGDFVRARELFETSPSSPALLGEVINGHFALALWKTGEPRRAAEVLRSGSLDTGGRALLARLYTELGEVEAARTAWTRVRESLEHEAEQTPRPPRLADAVRLEAPSLHEMRSSAAPGGQRPQR